MERSDVDLLQSVPSYHLQAILNARHITYGAAKGQQSTSSSSLLPDAVEVAPYVFDPFDLTHVIQHLEELESLLLRELVACGGRANSRDLAFYLLRGNLLTPAKEDAPSADAKATESVPLRYQQGGPPATPQYPSVHPHGLFEQAVRQLLLLGLLFWGKQTNFASREYASGVHDGVLIVPETVKTVVIHEWGDREPFTIPTLQHEIDGNGNALVDVGEGVPLLQRTLYIYWSLVATQREGLTLLNTGLLARAALRLVIEHMGEMRQAGPRMPDEQVRVESDVPHLLFVRLLLLKLELLREQNGAIHAVHPNMAERFFSLPLVERARRCYHLWCKTPFWNEMLYLPEVNVRPGPSSLELAHEEVLRARHTVIERLAHERTEEWHDIATFIARTKLYSPYLLFPRQHGPRAERYTSSSNPYGWDFRLRRGWLTHREGWHMVEGGFIRALLAGPLHWLGAIEINQEENPTAFRLSSGSVFLFSNAELQYKELPSGRLIVQPNFELVALAPLSEALLIQLDRFAERVSLEHIAQYRITKTSVTHAVQAGLHAETIKALLTQAANGDIPQNVQYSLLEWERQARRIEMWQATTLLEVDDTALLDALFADERAHYLFGRRLTPQLAEVLPQQLEAVQALLWQRGCLPSVVTAPRQDTIGDNGHLIVREPQWRLHDDGLLHPFYAVLDLYLVAELEHFSERDEETGWHRISPISIQRALQEGISLEYIIRFLQTYCDDGIPPSFLIRLKLWGGGYSESSTIAVEHMPMLRLSSQVLQDLQADQGLAMLLDSEVEQPSRLIRVSPEHLEQVLILLRERGFKVE